MSDHPIAVHSVSPIQYSWPSLYGYICPGCTLQVRDLLGQFVLNASLIMLVVEDTSQLPSLSLLEKNRQHLFPASAGGEDPHQYSAVHYSTVQYSTVQYSAVQYSTLQEVS